MAYAASPVSTSIKDAKVRNFITANRFIKILKSKDAVLSFPKIDDILKAALICFSNASFANLKHNSSKDKLLVYLEGSDRRYTLLTWESAKLKQVVKSTLTTEAFALKEVIEVAYMIRCLRSEIWK